MVPQESSSEGLETLLAGMPEWGSEFSHTFANHAPMVLVALHRIGAAPAQLRRFFHHYRDSKQLLRFAQPLGKLDEKSWRTAIGLREREPDLRLFFVGEVARLGIHEALALYLPHLADGIAASAFHALMRTAYGVLRADKTDVAIALAYWAATYLPLPRSRGTPAITDDPAEVLSLTAAIEPLHGMQLHDLLWQNMRDAGNVPEFAPVVDWLEIGPDTMEKMAATALSIFAATQHFAALHIITGLHWIRLLEPHCDEATLQRMLRVFWQGIAGLMGELGFPNLPDRATVDRWRHIQVPDWAELHAIAAQSFDEHDISLAFSASDEMKVYGDPLYRVVVARRLGLIGDYTK
ncbi:questin oxidase family protein [Rhizobium tumorigenes]|uniref:Questin oxidase family protein n=1 Tax=Rhizobium tumorigenes TaxID=2041385 RepID=A0AAF1KTR8_9HYPH|nr:questin oxidase family protein [Rhizobium tumorigenes]WFR99203.1 questin oxidase family protein [Rhizobium tumorigenes]